MHSRSRLTSLDALRGLAALAVALSHYGELAAPGYDAIWYALGQFGVSVFFVLSGFVISRSLEGRSLGSFWHGRIWRLLPAYIVALLLALVLANVGLWKPHEGNASTWSLLINLLLIQAATGTGIWLPVAWSLGVEAAFYGYITFGRQLGWSHNRTALLLLGLGALRVVWPSDAAALGFPLLGLGMLVAHERRSWLAIGLAWAWIVGLELLPGGALVRAVAPGLFLLALGWRGSIVQWLLWLGERSYSLYLLHMLWFGVAALVGPAPSVRYLVVWLLLALVSADLLYRLVERPALALSKRRVLHNERYVLQ